MNDSHTALLFTILVSFILSLVQIASDSNVSAWRSYFTVQLALYFIIMTIGNTVITLVAESLFDSYQKNPGKGMGLKGPPWLWYSFFGIFGFEAIIQKINVTIFDKGVLTVNDWITKAKTIAVDATLENSADLLMATSYKLAQEIHKLLDPGHLHTEVASILGLERYTKTCQSIQGNHKINEELFLANIAAVEHPKKVRAAIDGYKAANKPKVGTPVR